MEKRGIITRVTLSQFGTFRFIEVFPGPNLNIIMGPNGTGKSTIVSGIILGLGGSPKVIGRASKLSDYIKSNCEDAKIEIELNSDGNNRNVVITRQFNKSNHTVWHLNEKQVNQKEILEVIRHFNIQVENLCQFLPQDRVQDFAKMNKYELLCNVQKSLGDSHLWDMQKTLIDIRDEHKKLESNLKRISAKLQDAEQQNSRMEIMVQNINERAALTKNLEYMKSKILWINYSKLRERVVEIKSDRDAAGVSLKKCEQDVKEADKNVLCFEKKAKEAQSRVFELDTEINYHYNLIRKFKGKSDDILFSMESVKNECNRKINEEQQRDKEIKNVHDDIAKLNVDLCTAIGEGKNEQDIKREIQKIRIKLSSVDSEVDKLIESKAAMDSTAYGVRTQIEAIKRNITTLEDVSSQRIELLRRIDADAYHALLWLKSNRDKFNSVVHEPFMLQINVKTPSDVKYIEAIIPPRDLCAFACEDVNDMNLLLKYLRDEQKLKVNVIHLSHESSSTRKPSPVPIAHLKKYGMRAYVSDLFTSQEKIMNYLCNEFRLSSIPVGDASTFNESSEVPPKFPLFFSENHRFAVSFSRYTKEKIMRCSELNNKNRFLSVSVDDVQIKKLKIKLEELENKQLEILSNIEKIDKQLNTLNSNRSALSKECSELQAKTQQVRIISARLTAANATLETLQQERVDKDVEEKKCKQELRKLTLKLCSLQQDVFNSMTEYQTKLKDIDKALVASSVANSRSAELAEKCYEAKRKYSVAEQLLKRINSTYEVAKADAETAFDTAKRTTEGLTPKDSGFKKFIDIYDKFSDDVEELEQKIAETRVQINCIVTGDDDVLRQYEERVNFITTLTEDSEKITNKAEVLKKQMIKMREKWLPKLTELVLKIDSKFKEYFHKMGCSGEVKIVPGETEHDYGEYGLSICVRFRDEGELQELDQHVQSGGERAVSTALFMLSLQELTNVPFRCVDEINQGMDAMNERRVFELIVDATSKENMPQYFLLTPKLLLGLNYPETCKIHTIHNGPFEYKCDNYEITHIVKKIRSNLS